MLDLEDATYQAFRDSLYQFDERDRAVLWAFWPHFQSSLNLRHDEWQKLMVTGSTDSDNEV